MLPPIYTTLQASATVRSILGARPRLYGFAEAPQDKDKPYAVWQLVTGVPAITLSEPPGIDQCTVQVDLYATTEQVAHALGDAVRAALEVVTHVTAFRAPPREPGSRLFRISLDADYWLDRAAGLA